MFDVTHCDDCGHTGFSDDFTAISEDEFQDAALSGEVDPDHESLIGTSACPECRSINCSEFGF